MRGETVAGVTRRDTGRGQLSAGGRQRIRVEIRGAVQGVGFRPFIFRLARELGLTGWVSNSLAGVLLEAEGPSEELRLFRDKIISDKPVLAFIDNMQLSFFDPLNYTDFEIRPSLDEEQRTAMIMPDIATCPDCLAEVFAPGNRRYLYPFINCTHCGPRYAIIQRLPYDRANTSMSGFTMCASCRQEYENPASRFFHAQPVACPACGPQVTFWDGAGRVMARQRDALNMAVQAFRQGQVVAVKGLGGFHLMVDAEDEEAVQRLRRRKQRDEKPFAVMFPSLDAVSRACRVNAEELRLLESLMAPIVLLERISVSGMPAGGRVALAVAPGNPDVGAMLPFTPLHHILLREMGSPLVATSGNISDEPVCIDETEALARLKNIADCFLVHDRPIVRQVDDSLARVMAGRPLLLRRARGYAPLPVRCGRSGRATLAMGGQQKNTVALTVGDNIFVSQHIGDLDTRAALKTFQKTAGALIDLYQAPVEQVAHDRHPDYISTREAGHRGLPLVPVQHHHAHIVACMVDNDLDEEVLGLAWDGTGYGLDATIWGGEFLISSLTDFIRGGFFRPFPLPGGEIAVKEPWRAAWGALWEAMDGDMTDVRCLPCFRSRSDQELKVLNRMIEKQINTPQVSSVGRLFDAVAALTGVRDGACFEGQAAMALEFAARGFETGERYGYDVKRGGSLPEMGPWVADWRPMLKAIVADARAELNLNFISAKFHNTLIAIAVDIARCAGKKKIVLSGGCFQNKRLTEGLILQLRAAGFQPYWHQNIPPNDGGISLGQAVCAALKGAPA